MTLRKHLGAAPAVLLVAGLLVPGCAKKNSLVDPAYTLPEGRPSTLAKLVTWPSRGDVALVYAAANDPTTRADDTRIDTVITYPTTTPGAVNLQIIDGTEASAFELFRREPNGGFAPLRNYPLIPIRKWLDGHWSLTEDLDLGPGATPDYIARGIVAGATTTESPLTNESVANLGADTPATLVFDIVGSDSLQHFTWTADPAASGYFLEVFPLANLGSREDRIRSAAASPFVTLRLRDGITAFVSQSPAPAIRLSPSGIATGIGGSETTIFANRSLTPQSFYVVRVTAVDAMGRVINRLAQSFPDTYDFVALDSDDLPEGSYEALPVGGPVIAYGPTSSPARARGTGAAAAPLGWHVATNR